MPRRDEPRIMLSAREAVAAGAEFRSWDATFSDFGVARDEISALRASVEPLVLRVAVFPANPIADSFHEARALIEGDRFCDSGGSEPRRLPNPSWSHSDDARAWAEARTWLGAWERCADARWMLHAAAHVGVDRRLIALAACDCARTSLHVVPEGEHRPLRAIEVAEAWARNEVAMLALLSAGVEASNFASDTYIEADAYAANEEYGRADAAYAVAHAATACADAAATAAHPPFAVQDVADSASATAGFACSASTDPAARTREAEIKSLRDMAALVRGRISTVAVLRAVSWKRAAARA